MRSVLFLVVAACADLPATPEDAQASSARGWWWKPPPPPPPRHVAPTLGLTATDVIDDEDMVLTATGAEPGEAVWFKLGVDGLGDGPCESWLGGLCLDVVTPVFLGTGRPDADGVAVLEVEPPWWLDPGSRVGLQAVVYRGAGGIDTAKSVALLGTGRMNARQGGSLPRAVAAEG